MEFNFEIIKKHPYAVGGTLLAVFVIAYLYVRSKSTASTAATSDLSQGSSQLQSLTSAAQLANAQSNAQQTIAEVQGNVMNTQTAAQLQSDLAKTAAELQLGTLQTQASVATTLGGQQTAVELQQITSAADVQKTQIQGDAYTAMNAANDSVNLALIEAQSKQVQSQFSLESNVFNTLVNSPIGKKHFVEAIESVTPFITAGVAPAAAATSSSQAIAAVYGEKAVEAKTGGTLGILTGALGTAEQTQPFHF